MYFFIVHNKQTIVSFNEFNVYQLLQLIVFYMNDQLFSTGRLNLNNCTMFHHCFLRLFFGAQHPLFYSSYIHIALYTPSFTCNYHSYVVIILLQ